MPTRPDGPRTAPDPSQERPGAGGRRPLDEVKVCGRYACQALIERRPDDVLRAYVLQEELGLWSELLKGLARQRKPYKVVEEADLVALTESTHHEGICVVSKPRQVPTLHEVVDRPGPLTLVALGDVENPHNVGAILRTCAHFGVAAVLMAGRPRLPAAAVRTAQGGAEAVDVLTGDDLGAALGICQRAGLTVIATSSHDGVNLFEADLPDRVVLLLGSEGEGLDPDLLRGAEVVLAVPGTGAVESLNVGVAGAVVLGELWRRRGADKVVAAAARVPFSTRRRG